MHRDPRKTWEYFAHAVIREDDPAKLTYLMQELYRVLKDNQGKHMLTPEREPQRQGKMNFRCADVGPKTCDWRVSGNIEEEITPKTEQHGREN
jgi:hypothetical protein